MSSNDSSSEDSSDDQGQRRPRFVSPQPDDRPASSLPPPSTADHHRSPSAPPQPSPDAPREDSELFASRYVPFDGRGGSTEPLRPAAPRPASSRNPGRRKKLTGSRYVPIDGAGALNARPSAALLIAAAATCVAAVGLAVMWGTSNDTDRLQAGSLAVGVMAALALVCLAVWRFGTSRMAALMLLLCGGVFSCVALVGVIIQAGDGDPGIGPTAVEDDFDLLYGQCERDHDTACDVLYRTSWEGSVRSVLAQELTRDCGGRGLSGQGFCTQGLVDSDFETFAGEAAPGWAEVIGTCASGDMLACDLALIASPGPSIADTCGGRRQSSAQTCRSQFGVTAND